MYDKQTLTRWEDESASYNAFFFFNFRQTSRWYINIAIFVSIDQRPPRRARDKLLAAASSAMLPEGFDFSPPTGYRNSGPTSRHPAFPLCNVHRKLIGIGPLTRVCSTICLNKNCRSCQTNKRQFFNVMYNIILCAACIHDRQRVIIFTRKPRKIIVNFVLLY